MSAGRANTAAVPAPEADPDVGRRVRARRNPPFNVNMASDSIVRTGDQIHAIRKKDVSIDEPAPPTTLSEICESIRDMTKKLSDSNKAIVKSFSDSITAPAPQLTLSDKQAISADLFLAEFKKESEDASKRAYELTKASYLKAFDKEQKRNYKRKRVLDEQEKTINEKQKTLDEKEKSLDNREKIHDELSKALDDKRRALDEKQTALDETQMAVYETHQAEIQTAKETAKVAALACHACCDAPRCMLLLPCTHVFYCQTCLASETLRHPGGVKCPVCRARVTTSMRLHV